MVHKIEISLLKKDEKKNLALRKINFPMIFIKTMWDVDYVDLHKNGPQEEKQQKSRALNSIKT